jgi:hypothetical protein
MKVEGVGYAILIRRRDGSEFLAASASLLPHVDRLRSEAVAFRAALVNHDGGGTFQLRRLKIVKVSYRITWERAKKCLKRKPIAELS